MTSHRMKNGPDTTKLYKAAELRLYDYLLPSQTATDDGLPTVVRDAIFDVINGKRKTYRYMMFVGLLDGYRRMGYHVRFEVLDSQYYSTPQRRERLIMIGTTDEVATLPFPAPSKTLITAREVLSGFDRPGTGNNKGVCEARITLAKHPVLRVSAYAGMLFNGMGRPIDLSRPCQTLPASMGGNKTPIIDTRLLKDADAADWLKTIHIKAIKGVDLSKTKVPSFMRRITVSEAAALQGFPKDFEFCGSQCEKYKQIGNSVPPPFAYAIAREIIRRFTDR